MDNKIKLIAGSFGREKVKFNELLSNHTATRFGGPAKMFAVATTLRVITRLVEDCKQLNVPFLVIGTGSKVAFSDSGFLGVVIKNRTQNIKVVSIKGKVSKKGLGLDFALIEVDSGLTLEKFTQFLSVQGLEDGQFKDLTGSIGGNLFLNPALQERVENIRVLDENSELRQIIWQNLSLRKHVILSVVFKINAKSKI